jgi:hypothetical protein
MHNLSRRQYMKVSAGTINAITIAKWCHALTLLQLATMEG